MILVFIRVYRFVQQRTTVSYDQYLVPPKPITNQRFRTDGGECVGRRYVRHSGGWVVRGDGGVLVVRDLGDFEALGTEVSRCPLRLHPAKVTTIASWAPDRLVNLYQGRGFVRFEVSGKAFDLGYSLFALFFDIAP